MITDRITSVETFIADVPLKREFVFDSVRKRAQSLVITRIGTSGGCVGIGEASIPLDSQLSAETVETIQLVIDRYLVPVVLGFPIECPGRVRSAMDAAIGGQLAAKSAVEGAIHDAWARKLGVSLSSMLGGMCHEAVPVTWLLTGSDPFEVAEEARLVNAEAGFEMVTMRLRGSTPGSVSHACAVARLIDGHVPMHINASGSWPRIPAQLFSAELSASGVSLIEQPCAPSDIDTLARLTGRLEAAIAADEAVATTADAVELARRSAADVFTLHPTTSGGLRSAQAIAHIAEGAGVACRIGTTFGSEISVATALQLAGAIERLPFGTDLFGPLLIEGSLVTSPLAYDSGHVRVPTGPGIGVELDMGRVKEFRR